MGIENMPINCSDCPEVLCSKVNAEGARYLAENSVYDTSDDIPAEVILDILQSKHSLELTAEQCEKGYESVSQTYEQLARMFNCPGKNPISGECRLNQAINHNRYER